MGEGNNKKRTHRVGTVTCGTSLIIFGILFLLHMIVPIVSYTFIFKLWPCLFIILGIEVLAANCRRDTNFVYDKGAVFLLIVLSVFAMFMGFAEFCITHHAAGQGCIYMW